MVRQRRRKTHNLSLCPHLPSELGSWEALLQSSAMQTPQWEAPRPAKSILCIPNTRAGPPAHITSSATVVTIMTQTVACGCWSLGKSERPEECGFQRAENNIAPERTQRESTSMLLFLNVYIQIYVYRKNFLYLYMSKINSWMIQWEHAWFYIT